MHANAHDQGRWPLHVFYCYTQVWQIKSTHKSTLWNKQNGQRVFFKNNKYLCIGPLLKMSFFAIFFCSCSNCQISLHAWCGEVWWQILTFCRGFVTDIDIFFNLSSLSLLFERWILFVPIDVSLTKFKFKITHLK